MNYGKKSDSKSPALVVCQYKTSSRCREQFEVCGASAERRDVEVEEKM
jgi:hypothetical protein